MIYLSGDQEKGQLHEHCDQHFNLFFPFWGLLIFHLIVKIVLNHCNILSVISSNNKPEEGSGSSRCRILDVARDVANCSHSDRSESHGGVGWWHGAGGGGSYSGYSLLWAGGK